MKNEKTIGRPTINDSIKKSAKVMIYLTPTQKQQLQEIALTERKSLADVCVTALIKTKKIKAT